MEFPQEYIDFVTQHAADDPTRLRLRFHGDTRQWLPYAIDNIAALKKRKKFKLHDGRDFTPAVIPFELSAQQATSASIAQFHAELVGDAHTILDMTFGIGMDARFLAMDSNRRILGFDLREELVGAAKVNFADFPNVEVRHGDSVEFLNHYNGEKFDLIFIDPARRGSEGERLYNLHDCQPDLIELLPLIKEKAKRLIAKLSPMLDVTQTLRDLPGIVQLHVVEEGNECKELLAVVYFASGNEAIGTTSAISTAMICIDRLVSGERRQFAFTQAQEATTPLSLLSRMPVAGEFICEPSAATMKAAPFNLLSTKFEAPALHPNSHLYVAPTAPSAFPGNCYEICQAVALTSSNLKQIAKSVDRADIAVRNLKGFTSDVLRKRLKLKSGGNLRLFATTLATSAGDTPILVLCKLSAPLS